MGGGGEFGVEGGEHSELRRVVWRRGVMSRYGTLLLNGSMFVHTRMIRPGGLYTHVFMCAANRHHS